MPFSNLAELLFVYFHRENIAESTEAPGLEMCDRLCQIFGKEIPLRDAQWHCIERQIK